MRKAQQAEKKRINQNRANQASFLFVFQYLTFINDTKNHTQKSPDVQGFHDKLPKIQNNINYWRFLIKFPLNITLKIEV